MSFVPVSNTLLFMIVYLFEEAQSISLYPGAAEDSVNV